jgi:hypothetical protein
MRSLLLGTTIGKIYWVKGIQHIWPLLLEGIFIAIAVVEQSAYGQEQIWKLFHQTQLKIGILCKKSTSGKKSFFRSIGLDFGQK